MSRRRGRSAKELLSVSDGPAKLEDSLIRIFEAELDRREEEIREDVESFAEATGARYVLLKILEEGMLVDDGRDLPGLLEEWVRAGGYGELLLGGVRFMPPRSS